jgi:hypothetical protein
MGKTKKPRQGGVLKSVRFSERDLLMRSYPPESGFQINVDLLVSGIMMLAHHDAEEANQPLFCTAMFASFQPVINFLSLDGTLQGRSTFVDIIPLVAVAGDRQKQARIVLGVRVHAATVGRIRARRITSTEALLH